MASFWFWFFLSVISLIAGFVFVIVVYGGWSLISGWWVKYKNRIPKKRGQVSEWLRDNKEKVDFTEKQELNLEQEVKDEQRRNEKFREFEKLRRIELKKRIGGIQVNNSPNEGAESVQGRQLLQNVISPSSGVGSNPNQGAKPKVRLDD